MTTQAQDDLAVRLNTTGAFDTPWLKEQLLNWNVKEEEKKSLFMEHLYHCSGRTNGVYTGLWQEFCIKEAGPIMRNKFFDMLDAVIRLQNGELRELQLQQTHEFTS